ncbi:MAG: HAD hydrolase-like protein [Proteobacteria bacterium]|nr:HAD hydrolase-like protein [Pseudomonadota bacterium]
MTDIFFDLDGTLTDPKVGLTKSIQFALTELDVAPPSSDDLTWCIGPPLLDSFRTLVGTDLAPRALDLYRDRFSEIGWRENEICPGVAKMLEHLVRAEHRLYVATSKPRIFATRIVEHFELAHFLVGVFGSELDGSRSDKSELLRFAVSKVCPETRSVMVGDRAHDIVGARSNDMTAIGVTWGSGSERELATAGADVLVRNPDELISAVETGS